MWQQKIALDRDPFDVFAVFSGQRGLYYLDSSLNNSDGRYSYIGFDPVRMIRAKSLDKLRPFCPTNNKRQAYFQGGLVGYCAYSSEHCFGLYDKGVVIDHQKRQLIFYAKNQTALKDIQTLWARQQQPHPLGREKKQRLSFYSDTTRAQYESNVRQALKHISNGDIYQINLARQISLNVAFQHKAQALYAHMRRLAPTPFAAYFDDGRQIILSVSPERFVKVQNDLVQVRPMKGTRPRGKTPREDARLKKELSNDPKEIAELLMVTDLERNDLGRVCRYGSIKVSQMRHIETYNNVFQATSTVEGKLHHSKDRIDLLKAIFPSGSVTGCPKIEAMRLIEAIERSKRGIYTGAFGYLGTDGNMEMSVLIRTIVLEPNKLTFYVGSGIVADSNPAKEYQETCLKAESLIKACEALLGGTSA